MKITIDTDICRQEDVPVEVALYMMALYLDCPIQDALAKAAQLGHVQYFGSVMHPVKSFLSLQGKSKIESIIAKSNKKSQLNKYTMLADALRDLFPKGRKEGTNYMWKDSTETIANKLRVLEEKYNVTIDPDEAIAATKRYIESFNGNYTYMQLLKYFILKKDNKKGEETSQLLSFMQNEDAETMDWMDTVR